MKTKTRSSAGLVTGFIFSIFLFFISFPVSWLGEYYNHLNQFSLGVKNYDRDEAINGLENLKEDYNRFARWKFQYLSDKFLFSEMHLYEASVSLLNEDYEKAEKEDLKNRNGWQVSYFSGISKFWVLHAAYQEAMVKKDKKNMALILGMVIEEVKSDFEKCVRECPGPVENFNCSFNYDLVSNPKSAVQALANPKPEIKYILGSPGGDESKEDGKEPGKKNPISSDGKEPSQGGTKKKG